jgi:hypothetical protein
MKLLIFFNCLFRTKEVCIHEFDIKINNSYEHFITVHQGQYRKHSFEVGIVATNDLIHNNYVLLELKMIVLHE